MADNKQHIDDLLRDALGDYAEQPPSGAWADMEAKLNNKPHIDDIFREGLGTYAEQPPVGAWADMEARLDNKKRRRRGFVWYWLAAGLVGILLAGYLYLDNGNGRLAAGDATHEAAPVINMPVTTEASPSAGQAENEDPVAPATEAKPEQTQPQVEKKPKPTQHPAVSTPENGKQSVAETGRKEDPVVADQSVPQAQQETGQDKQTVQEPIPAQEVADPTPALAQEPALNSRDTIKEIAELMKSRKTPVLMNIHRSPSMDSMAQQGTQESEQQVAASKDTVQSTSDLAAAEPVKEEQPPVAASIIGPQPDTVSYSVAAALQETEKTIQPVQDAILPASQQVQVPADPIVFQQSEEIKEKAQVTTLSDSEKGSLSAFIGPEEDTAHYGPAFAGDVAAADSSLPGRKRKLQTDIIFKTGYERGFDKMTLSRFVLAPTIQAKLSDKISLIFQPAIKIAGVNKTTIGSTQSFHTIRSSYMDSIKTFSVGHNAQGIIFDSVKANYFYQQTHDSLVVSHNFSKRNILEVELPVMVNYYLGKGWSVYGGPVMSYSGMPQISMQLDRYNGATLRDTVVYSSSLATIQKTPPPINEVFTYNTKDFSTYDDSPYQNGKVNKLRFGAMLGTSLSINRVSMDLSVQQNMSRLNYIPNSGVRNLYLQPYVRFMLGYRLYSNKK